MEFVYAGTDTDSTRRDENSRRIRKRIERDADGNRRKERGGTVHHRSRIHSPINSWQWIVVIILHTTIRICIVICIISRRGCIAEITQH